MSYKFKENYQIQPPPDNILLHSKWAITEPNFDVQTVKKKYFKLLRLHLSLPQTRNLYLNRQQYEDVARELYVCEKLSKEGKSCSDRSDHYYMHSFLSHYQLHRDDTGIAYVANRGKQSVVGPPPKIVVLEDTFDILTDLHLLNEHCKNTKLRQLLKERNYDVKRLYLNCIIASCNICQNTSAEKSDNILENKKYIVEIYPMYPCTDGDFKYIFYCKDTLTQYVFLRPLIEKCQEEVAIEIMKIITTFGSPQFTLVSSAENLEFFNNITKFVSQFGLSFVTCMETEADSDKKYLDIRIITDYLHTWMEETGSINWGLGCHIVQYNLNNKVIDTKDNEKHSAYMTVFKQIPITHRV